MERVNLKRLPSHAKLLGTLVTLGGAIIMTLLRGPTLELPWSDISSRDVQSSDNPNDSPDPIKGAVMITAGCFCYSLFYILQAITLKSYPAGLSLTALICTFGSLQGTVLTFVVERRNISIWDLGWDAKVLALSGALVIVAGLSIWGQRIPQLEKNVTNSSTEVEDVEGKQAISCPNAV